MSVDETGRRSYRPGDWFAVVGGRAVVLLPPTEKRRVGALWELVDDGADADEVLDALIASGLRDLPGFVLLSDVDDTTRVVVRGAARATFETADGPVEIDPAGAGTWVERTLHGVTSSVLDVTTPDAGPDAGGADADETLTLVDGLVRVSWVRTPALPVVTGPVGESAPSDDRPVDGGHGLLGAAGLAGAGAGALAASPAVAAPEPEPEPEPAPIPEPEPFTEPEPESEPAAQDEAGEPTELLSLSDLDDPPADGPADQPADEPGQDLADVPPPPAPSEQPQPFGRSGPPSAPAFGAGGPPPERPQWTPAPPPPNPFAPPPGPPPGPGSPGPGGPGPFGGPPPAAPGWGEPAPHDPAAHGEEPPTEQAPVDAPEGGDHDGDTNAGDYDPSVYARQQPGIPGQPPAPSVTARPVARLVMSHGESIDVDRAILIGRAPEARRFTASEEPRLVTVPSPHQEISSTHLEVRPGSGADHGSAVVTDTGSTNGTVLVQPGLPPEDLQPGIAVQLIPGAVIDLGDGLTIQVANP